MIKILFLLILLVSSFCYADLYYWIDENGVKHFSNTQPEDSTRSIEQTEEYVYEESEDVEYQEKDRGKQIPAIKQNKNDRKRNYNDHPKVVMYMTPTCGYCHRARAFFNKHRVPFVEYNITTSKKARKKFESLNGRGVPLILIGNQKISGFNEPAIRRALGIL